MLAPTSRHLEVNGVRLRSAFDVLGGVAVLAVAALVLFVPAAALGSSTIVVTNTNDSGTGSLRQAIIDANEGPGNTIVFHIPSGDPNFNGSWFTIGVFSQLPVLSAGETTIDGASQTSFSGDTNPLGPEIFLQARSQVFPENGAIVARSSSNVIAGLAIGGFPVGVVVGSGDGNVVRGDYLGTDPTGTVRGGNNNNVGVGFGTRLPDGSFGGDSTNTLIGGPTLAARNVISGNGAWGIDLIHTGSTSNVVIEGNYIGTNAKGDASLGIQQAGINAGPISGLTIGGAAPGAGNLISGNSNTGIGIGGTVATTIQGNRVGTDAGGTYAIPNGLDGIDVTDGARNTLVGGESAGAGNLLSGNARFGVIVTGGSNGGAANGAVIEGNRIGTNAAGTAALGNGTDGVRVGSFFGTPTNVTVGGSAPGAGNVISGNGASFQCCDDPTSTGAGVGLSGVDGIVVQGNLIGTDAGGTYAIPNTEVGVTFFQNVSHALIGGPTADARNVISGNLGPGIILGSGSSSNRIVGNYVGTNAAATAPIPNQGPGIALFSQDDTDNQIGGAATGSANVLSGNAASGIFVGGDNTTVQGNYIGSNAAGVPLPNAFNGVVVAADGSQITSNTISSNGANGIDVAGGVDNAISRNSIFSNGRLGIDVGDDGVTPNDPGDADVGPNNFQNFPVFNSALVSSGHVVVRGTIDTPSPQTVVLEFFANPVPIPGGDPSGYGEGETFLGTATPEADGNFTAVLPSVAPGTVISATATDAAGNTSEFALDARALLASADQCKNGGWQSFGVFKNQGDCVSFVATGGKNAAG
jgi:parallel beta-helix repeat protein